MIDKDEERKLFVKLAVFLKNYHSCLSSPHLDRKTEELVRYPLYEYLKVEVGRKIRVYEKISGLLILDNIIKVENPCESFYINLGIDRLISKLSIASKLYFHNGDPFIIPKVSGNTRLYIFLNSCGKIETDDDLNRDNFNKFIKHLVDKLE